MICKRKSLIFLCGMVIAILLSSCSFFSTDKTKPTQTTSETKGDVSETSTEGIQTVSETTPRQEHNYTEPVYDDTVHEPFRPGTWGDAQYSLDEARYVNRGSKAISVQCGAWEAFEFFRRSENWEEIYYMFPNRYQSVTFSFNPGESTEDDAGLCLSLDKGAESPVTEWIEGKMNPDTWYEVTIPLSDMNPESEPMARLVFFNQSDSPSAFYIDDVRLNCREDYTSPIMSRVAVEVGTAGSFAVIRFSTSERATAELSYGVGTPAETILSSEYRIDHEFTITGLLGGKKYEYRIRVADHPGDGTEEPNITEESGSFVATANYGITSFVSFTVDTTIINGTISPYIYGRNFFDEESFSGKGYPFGRIGGNRWTAYNWENNASNAGGDWYYHNDAYLSASDEPAAAIIDRVTAIFGADAAALVTVPIQGYVAKDKDGTDVYETEDYLSERFLRNLAFKEGNVSKTPNQSDGYVYQEEFVAFLEKAFPIDARGEREIFYCLDNEPALWATTHSPIQPEPITYSKLTDKNIEFARAIKSAVPQAEVFGFVGYGYNAFINLQDAPDSGHYGEFIDFYLTRLSKAEKDYGKRLIDVLDIHWYPEAQDDEGNRITSESDEEKIAKARMQAPRSLWDPSYTETSWITEVTGRPIALIPWLKEKINRCYPGTRLAITEYYFGGSDDISGAIAQADFLGIAGREGLFAASLWPISDIEGSYMEAAFDMYLNYDGNGSEFGDRSVSALTSDNEVTSVYAALDSNNPDRLVIMAINKGDGWAEALIDLGAEGAMYTSAEMYTLSEAFATPEKIDSFRIDSKIFAVALPAESVTCLVLSR